MAVLWLREMERRQIGMTSWWRQREK